MSVESVNELFTERNAEASSSGTTASRMFRVITSTSNNGPLTAVNAEEIPLVGADHPDDPTNLWVDKKNATPEGDDGMHWKVKVDYVLKPPASVGGIVKQWDRDPVISYGYMARSKVMEYCYHAALNATELSPELKRAVPGIKVVNSIHQPFDPPVMDEDAVLVISIQRNKKQSDFNPTDIQTFQNTMNLELETIAGIAIPKYCGWIKDIKAAKQFDQDNSPYWSETIEILVDPKTWLKKVLDQGFFVGDSSSGYMELTPVKDTEGSAIRDPIMLDGAGQRNPAGNPAVYIYFHSLWELSWAPFNLPGAY